MPFKKLIRGSKYFLKRAVQMGKGRKSAAVNENVFSQIVSLLFLEHKEKYSRHNKDIREKIVNEINAKKDSLNGRVMSKNEISHLCAHSIDIWDRIFTTAFYEDLLRKDVYNLISNKCLTAVKLNPEERMEVLSCLNEMNERVFRKLMFLKDELSLEMISADPYFDKAYKKILGVVGKKTADKVVDSLLMEILYIKKYEADFGVHSIREIFNSEGIEV